MKIGGEQAYFSALILANILAWASFLSIIFFTNPKSAGTLGVIILYVSFAAGLVGIGLLIWQAVKIRR